MLLSWSDAKDLMTKELMLFGLHAELLKNTGGGAWLREGAY